MIPCADPEGKTGAQDPSPLENHTAISFLSKTSSDPLENTKLPGQHSMFGHYLPASETPFLMHLLL